MSAGAALMRAILEAPAEDTPRLACADGPVSEASAEAYRDSERKPGGKPAADKSA